MQPCARQKRRRTQISLCIGRFAHCSGPMRSTLLLLLLLFLSPLLSAEPEFPLTDDSKPQAGVPKGELIKDSHTAIKNSVFPGTEREYTLYLPHGFDKSKPAPFMVFQDGVIYQAPVAFDNLMARKEIPPLVGIFVKPGVVPAANENALPRFNRSYEYDSITDTYARFLIDELLPAIEQKHGIKLSTDPNDASISGNSSGGIAAFMVAWHRPDRFRRVFTGVGTYVGIHGGDQLPVLVRKFEPKPIKIFLQSGTGDNNLYCGDWWMANQMMERSFTWAGYDVNHAWGEGGHNQKHASQIFPEALRWLWKGWPENKEVKANPRGESKWRGYEVCAAPDPWKIVFDSSSLGQKTTVAEHLTTTIAGTVFAWPKMGHGLLAMHPDHKVEFLDAGMTLNCYLPSKDSVFFRMGDPRNLGEDTFGLIVKEQNQMRAIVGRELSADVAVIDHAGTIFSGRSAGTKGFIAWRDGKVLANTDGDVRFRFEAWGLTLSPDQSLLFASGLRSPYVYSIQIGPDGKLSNFQSFAQLELASDGWSWAQGLCVDTAGRLYVATAMGVQVCDQAGRVNFIIPTPQRPCGVCFGGKDLSELFIACGDKIYKRQTKVRGIVSGQMPPIKPAPPKL
jgi:gluconolactonase